MVEVVHVEVNCREESTSTPRVYTGMGTSVGGLLPVFGRYSESALYQAYQLE